ncbi:hypothetical protein C8J25_108185 [Sphingomonas faeni]|uniref:Uncharacterized protein n=1 Tax=Sphingomonas faeni TaxID=185950 RepID=A0A2T5U0P8_9SPHN|nr:hypothetical protein [Sphingomonas faeni]PTW45093.1 hypothetical protein C8J25_108185 [Sphingomonas faeni]
MKTRVHVSGSIIWDGNLDFAPPIGSEVSLVMQGYESGYFPGSIITFTITTEDPPVFDLTADPPVLILDANGYRVDREAPVPPGQDY